MPQLQQRLQPYSTSVQAAMNTRVVALVDNVPGIVKIYSIISMLSIRPPLFTPLVYHVFNLAHRFVGIQVGSPPAL
jgi:hypothetical protein